MTGQDRASRRPATTESPWWTDALADPWRDPATPTEIELPARPAPQEAPPAPVDPPGVSRRPGRLVLTILVTAVLTGVVAGTLGGALGYLVADRDGATVLGAGSRGAPRDPAPAPDSLAAAVDKVLPSVVTVRAGRGGGGDGNLGSGFIASPDGYLITNDHVIAGAGDSVSVTFHNGTETPARVVGREPGSDVAVLKVDRRGLSPVEFGNSDVVAVGDPVIAVGSPFSLANTVTSGIVSAVDRTIRVDGPGDAARYYAAIQTDAAVNQGNSGGPLVDASGRVVGVNAVIKSVGASRGGAGSIGLAFAVPIGQAERIATEIIDTGEASRTVIGAGLDRGGSATDHDGVRLTSVAPGGPAEDGGLRAGDVLRRLDGRWLEEPADLVALVRKHDPGSRVAVEYVRGGAPARTTVTLVADR